MRRFGRGMWPAVGLLAAMLVAGSAPLVAQQKPLVTGRVTDKASGRPINGARVTLVGTTEIETANQDGRFTIRTPVSGEFRIRVNAIGYQSETRGSTYTGAAVEVDFALAAAAVQLDEVVSTATGETSRLAVPTTTSTVKADSLAAYGATSNLSDVLNGRAPGVTVQTSGGTTGGGTRIRIRGANSISLSNDPIVYIDGIRVSSGSNDGDIGNNTGGQSPSRLNDLNPDDIESIDIIKGPAGATLYGTDGSSGVIVVKTKRGSAGKTKWNIYAEGGILNDKNNYPANYTAFGVRGGVERSGCRLYRVDSGACTATDSVVSFNTLRNPLTSPYGTGFRQQYGLNISGGTDALQYFVSGDFNDEVGVLKMPQAQLDSLLLQRGVTSIPYSERRPNAIRKVSIRSQIHANVSKNIDITTSLGFNNSDGRFPQNDNNLFGVISSAALGSYTRETAWGFFTPAQVFNLATTQAVQRITGSNTANWRPTSWLAGKLTVGLDQTQRQNIFFSQPGIGPAFANYDQGLKTDNKYTTSIYTADLSFTGTKKSGDLSSKTTVGAQWFRTATNGALTQGAFFAPGGQSIGGSAQQQAAETQVTSVTAGAFAEEVLGYQDRLFLTAGLRADKASGFGVSYGTLFTPKVGLSYVLRDNPSGTLGTVRLRAAYGQSSRAPGAFDSKLYYNPVQLATPNGTVVGATLGSLGNAGLKPERSAEFEGGIDAALFDNRLSVELTAYSKKTTDALVRQPIAPSAGTGDQTNAVSRFVNLGSVQNQGIELGLNARVLNGKTVSWDVIVTGSLLRNKVLSLGTGIAPFALGFTQRVVAGYPIGGYWDYPYSVLPSAAGKKQLGLNDVVAGKLDANGAVIPGSDTLSYVGALLPTRELGLNSAFNLFNNTIRISTQLDYRGGNYMDNSTEYFRCGSFVNCQALFDPKSSIADQAYALAALKQIVSGNPQKADFLRLREVAVTFFAPKSIASKLGADRASITFAGRNLALWTKYKGVDPEANNFGQANFATSDFLTQPPIRYLTARVNLSY